MRIALIAMSCFALSGCAIFEDVMAPDGDAQTKVASAADAQSLTELSISNGRYSVMLGQAREILRLPEPKAAGNDSGVSATDDAQERAQLAKSQALVANEFLADTARACQRRKLSKGVRAVACAQQKKVPADIRTPVAPEIAALSARNDALGDVVMTWWDAVCATAPKPKAGEPSACSIE
jgi:hypothetical protein